MHKFLLIPALLLSISFADVRTFLLSKSFVKSGTFTPYDFAGVSNAFDWVFVLNDGKVFQLQGNAPSVNNVFGWKSVDVDPHIGSNAWNMIYIGDFDKDGQTKFDWVLYANQDKITQIYKLDGVSAQGTFVYKKIDGIRALIDGINVTFEDMNAQSSSSSSSMDTLGDKEMLEVKDSQDLRGYIFQTNESILHAGSMTIKQQITLKIDCSGHFDYTQITKNSGYEDRVHATGDSVNIDWNSIHLHGNDDNSQIFDENLFDIKNDYLVVGKSCVSDFGSGKEGENCPNHIYLQKITRYQVCQ
ncbi:hypothetical protein NitYY0826_C1687 [Nitratiruptor sp. YY08-26]|uniref:hypothetical protein n=1 Tax=unclassified Nitratiruptor TaxID=2624044 RepID=UPI00191637CC|nr:MULTISPECIES: hypothetical protein [unclassified Nitratiruptor]BCD62802.1 hypothetical protein NitYY0813_C1685 [Nitratiruptor sp. YY08-13]BCD66738.1 hypothetical protein NitYY0826_C1687 [Nitratiruptor sp. YY08-26]